MEIAELPGVAFYISNKYSGNMYVGPQSTNNGAAKRRENYLLSHGLNPQEVVSSYQVHGKTALVVTEQDKGKTDLVADALVTNTTDLTLLKYSADCNVIFLLDPATRALANIHAGREGLRVGIATSSVDQMTTHFKSRPSDLIAYFNPSIGPCCYQPFNKDQTPEDIHRYLKENRLGTLSLDIWEMAQDQLLTAGLHAENIHNPRVCTYHNKQYYSHRRAVAENDEDGNMLIAVRLKP